jgi:septum formation protein
LTLILASSSPRRKALLARAGIAFRAATPDVDETAPAHGDPHRVALENAEAKARAVLGDLVLGADTVVAVGDRLLGKARDEDDARVILRALSGTTHRVVTGVALRAKTRLFFRSP